MPTPYSVLSVPDVEPISAAGVLWKPLRRTLGISAFGINAYTAAAAGETIVEEHTETRLGHEEAYLVLSGHARFTLDGRDHDAPHGTLVFVRDPAVRRTAVAVEPGTVVVAIGGIPGSHEPSAWEWYFAAERFRPSRDHEAALELLGEALELFPDHAGVLYSVACWEALAGNDDDALRNLRRALELDPGLRAWAAEDDDLASVRDRLPG